MCEAVAVVLLAGMVAAGSGIGAADVHNETSMADAEANMRRVNDEKSNLWRSKRSRNGK